MKTKTLNTPKAERSVRIAPKTMVSDSFETDWKNGISGEEVVKRVHIRIKEWWNTNRENGKI
jgi:hypothetical protein